MNFATRVSHNIYRTGSVDGQAGLSIIELMIALLLGSLLILGVTQIFISNSQTFRINEATARVQENARLASEILGRAIRGAGFVGCKPINAVTNNLDTTNGNFNPLFDQMRPGRGITSEVALRPAAANGTTTDFLALSRVSSPGLFISAPAVNSASFVVNDATGLSAGDRILVGNCVDADLAQISSIAAVAGGPSATITVSPGGASASPPRPGNSTNQLQTVNRPSACTATNCFSATYSPAHVMLMQNEAYFIGTSAGRNGLFLTNGDQTFELVSGIEDMQIRYVVNNAGTLSFPEPANTGTDTTNWDLVTGVEVSLLVRGGDDDLLETAQTVCYPSWAASCNVTMPDRALYRVVEFVTSLRNP